MSAAGPSQGRLHERGEAKARSARPRVLAAADALLLRLPHKLDEAANSVPLGGSAAAAAASVGVVYRTAGPPKTAGQRAALGASAAAAAASVGVQ
jgi:hypothetical protein